MGGDERIDRTALDGVYAAFAEFAPVSGPTPARVAEHLHAALADEVGVAGFEPVLTGPGWNAYLDGSTSAGPAQVTAWLTDGGLAARLAPRRGTVDDAALTEVLAALPGGPTLRR
jgi:hypothetical protein